MNKMVVILGAGESGLGSAILAQKQGWETFVSDMGAISTSAKTKLKDLKIKYEEKTHSEEIILQADVIIKSPGIPEKAAIIRKIRAEGIRIESEIEFAYRYIGQAKTIAITGTNGKTTTTSLIYRILKDANLSVAYGGNIGHSFANLVAKFWFSF